MLVNQLTRSVVSGFIIVLSAITTLFLCTEASAAQDSPEKSVSINFGTGWLISPGLVVTNNHVVAQHDTAVIVFNDNSEANTSVLVRDKANDLALLRITDNIELPAGLPLALSSPALGEPVFTIGYPHPTVMGSNPKLSEGIISSRTGLANDPRFYQISTPVQAGNSGGPLLNMNGEVVGIVTSKLNAMKMFKWTGDIPQNVNYAVKTNYLRSLIDLVSTENRKIDTLPRKRADLVGLADRIKGSIVRIKSGVMAAKVRKVVVQQAPVTEVKKAPMEKNKAPEVKASKVALFIHMTKGNYSNTGDLDSMEVYSKGTADVLTEYLEKDQIQKFKVTHNVNGKSASRMYYKVYSKRAALKLCKKYDVDYLIATKNDYSIISYYYEEFQLVLKDCKKNTELAKMYYVDAKTHDKFNYEIDIRDAVRKFLILFHDQN